jgi:hypothetical protein
VFAGRDQDWVDARSLLRFAREQDLEQAREAMQLILLRGGEVRDLLADFEALLHEKI